MSYNFIRVCNNGHIVSARNNFCQECGAPVLSECPVCGTSIKENGFDFFSAPKHCHYCGTSFPWRESALNATAELLAEDENITPEECNRLIEVLPDAMAETPRSNLAAVRIRKAFNILGSFASDGLRQFLLDYACEFVKQQIGL